MIQRKQTLYLLLAAVATLACLSLPLGSIEQQGMGVEPVLYNIALVTQGNTGASLDFTYAPLAVLLAVTAILELTAIFLFKNRMRQSRLCAISIAVIFAWIVLFMYFKYFGMTETGQLQQGFAAYLPFVSAVFNWLAFRAIRADEQLVRSADRIR